MKAHRPLLVLPLLLLLAAVLSPPTLAQGAALESLEVAIWPEYDRPAALVILKAFLPASTPLPATVELPMPIAANQPTAVAWGSAGGQLMNATWDFAIEGEFTLVQIEARGHEARLEYYLPLDISGTQRRFRFEWPGGASVGRVTYEVMQPVGGEGLIVVPAREPPQREGDGLLYQRGDLGSVEAGAPFDIELGYTKEGPALTAPALAAAAPAPAGPAVAPAQSAVEPSTATPAAPPRAAAQPQGVSAVWRYIAVAAIAVSAVLFFLLMRR